MVSRKCVEVLARELLLIIFWAGVVSAGEQGQPDSTAEWDPSLSRGNTGYAQMPSKVMDGLKKLVIMRFECRMCFL